MSEAATSDGLEQQLVEKAAKARWWLGDATTEVEVTMVVDGYSREEAGYGSSRRWRLADCV